MTSAIFFDYLASGDAADRPADPNTDSVFAAGPVHPDSIVIWLSRDTGILSIWNTNTAAWIDIPLSGLSDLSGFDTDDLAEGATNKYYTPERARDDIGSAAVGGNGVTVTVDDPGDTITFATAITLPQGRLTLTTAVPVLVATVSAAGTVYYTPYQGANVPLYNGTKWINTPFTEVSQATTDATKSPAACANNSNYDIFRLE
jgi:hypothetical protein